MIWTRVTPGNPSMHGIFANSWLIFVVNLGKYTIHGCYGLGQISILVVFCWLTVFVDHLFEVTSNLANWCFYQSQVNIAEDI